MILEEYDEQSHMASERQEWREIGRKEGREEGCAIGISKGLANAVLELLGTLGEVSDRLRDRILQEENHDILKKWLKLASDSDTVKMFWERME